VKPTCKAALLVLMFASLGPLHGQTISTLRPSTFHVEGTMSSAWDSILTGTLVPRKKLLFRGEQPIKTVSTDDKDSYVAVPRTEITFHGAHATKTVTVNDKGFYQADLPIGVYKMTVEAPTIGSQALTPYERVFRVRSSGTVVLNGALYMAHMTCDIMVGGTPGHQSEETKNACGGEDRFSTPSKDGTPLELYIRYGNRDTTDQGYGYSGDRHPERIPVFVAYNLFALEADGVSYDRKNGTITAVGNVVTEDGSGKMQHFDSFVFRIEDGQAIPLKAPANQTGGPPLRPLQRWG
jgi:hypothetical protein